MNFKGNGSISDDQETCGLYPTRNSSLQEEESQSQRRPSRIDRPQTPSPQQQQQKQQQSNIINNIDTYVLLENYKKSNTLGPIIRCIAAFNISTVYAVGYSKYNIDGSFGTSKHVNVKAFATMQQCINDMLLCKDNNNDDEDDDDDENGNDVNENENENDCTEEKRSSHEVERIKNKRRDSLSLIGVLGGIPIIQRGQHHSSLPVQENKETHLYKAMATITTCPSENDDDNHASNGSNKIKRQPSKVSCPIGSHPFPDQKQIYCFVIDCKSKRGLSSSLANHCDMFVHIPHASLLEVSAISSSSSSSSSHGHNFTATAIKEEPPLLDVASCLSIVLHHYTEWMATTSSNGRYQYSNETMVQGYKFQIVKPSSQKDASNNAEEIKKRQQAKQEQKKQRQLEYKQIMSFTDGTTKNSNNLLGRNLFMESSCDHNDY